MSASPALLSSARIFIRSTRHCSLPLDTPPPGRPCSSSDRPQNLVTVRVRVRARARVRVRVRVRFGRGLGLGLVSGSGFGQAAEPIGEVRLLSCGEVDAAAAWLGLGLGLGLELGLDLGLGLGLGLVDAAAAGDQREAEPLVVRLEREGAEDLVRVRVRAG
eukprot:scaffold31652_cov59-Phaeocystis_antarctica.AAC.1